jgi:glycosyltransferase involved in cell wall biosynthesis
MKDSQKLLSVVIPIATPDRYLMNLENWIRNEDFEDVEIFIIHDRKDNESSDCLLYLISIFPDISISLESQEFKSPGLARNAGIKKTSGRWVTFLDADDYQHTGVIKEAVRDSKNADMIVGQFQRINSTGKQHKAVNTNLVSEIWIDPGFWRIAYKRDLLLSNTFSDLKMGEDIVFLADILREKRNISFSKAIFYDYLVGNPFQSSANPTNFQDLVKAIRLIMSKNPEWPTHKNDRGFLNRLALSYLKHSLTIKNFSGLTFALWVLSRIHFNFSKEILSKSLRGFR